MPNRTDRWGDCCEFVCLKAASINLHYAGEYYNRETASQYSFHIVNAKITGLYTTASFIHRGFRSFTLFHRPLSSRPARPRLLFSTVVGSQLLLISFTRQERKNSPLFISSFSLFRFNNIPRFLRPSINFRAYLPPPLHPPSATNCTMPLAVNFWSVRASASLYRALIHFFLIFSFSQKWSKCDRSFPRFLFLSLSLSLSLSSEIPLPRRTCCSPRYSFRLRAQNDSRSQINVPRTMPVVNHVLPNILTHSIRGADEKVDESGWKWIDRELFRKARFPFNPPVIHHPSAACLSLSLSLFFSLSTFRSSLFLFLTRLILHCTP